MADTTRDDNTGDETENGELDNFRYLTQKLLKVPKAEVDALRKSLDTKEPKP